ncbi:MAG: high-potential iron-sulfur protein [Candidatus Cybelea sp.]|jgi:hypothetical protein
MMRNSSNDPSRRNFLSGIVVLPALAGLALAQTTEAEAKGTQAAFKYQGTPKNGQKCSLCKFFVKGSSATANGSCSLVAGTISPNGWCIAYAKK